jgi:hypothetical protein
LQPSKTFNGSRRPGATLDSAPITTASVGSPAALLQSRRRRSVAPTHRYDLDSISEGISFVTKSPQMERLAKQKPDEDGAPAEPPETSWEASFDPAQPSPQFSFAGTTTYSKADLEKEIQDLGWWTS